MTIYDEDGFAIQEYEGKQVRSNFWNQIQPKITDQLEKTDGFNIGIGEWHYYVKEIIPPDGHSYFVVYKNPNFKKQAWNVPDYQNDQHPLPKDYDSMKEKERKDRELRYQQATVKYNLDIGKAKLEQHADLAYVKESLLLPKHILDNFVSIIVIKKNVNIQIPEMYELIGTIENITILGIKRGKYETVSVRDVFGVS
jgi:hypothetical protein